MASLCMGGAARRALVALGPRPRREAPEDDGAGLWVLFGRGDSEAFEHGVPVIGRAGDDRGEVDRNLEGCLGSGLAAFGEFPAEALGKVSADRAAAKPQVAIGHERGFRPGAVETKRAGAFRGEGIFRGRLHRFQNGNHPLRGRLLRVRHIGGNAADADAGRFQRFALRSVETRC